MRRRAWPLDALICATRLVLRMPARAALLIVALVLVACRLTGSAASTAQPYGETGRLQPSTASGRPGRPLASPTLPATPWQAVLSCPACARDGLLVDLWKDPLPREPAGRLPDQIIVTVLDRRQAGGTLFYYVTAQGRAGWVADTFVQPGLPGAPAGQTAPAAPLLSATATNPHGAGARPSPTVFTPAPAPTETARSAAPPASTRTLPAAPTAAPSSTPRPPRPTTRPVAPSPTPGGGKG